MLLEIQRSLMPLVYASLLDRPHEWLSLLVDDEEPYVRRLFRRFPQGQISLHEIPPCMGKPLIHRHRRPSAVEVVHVPAGGRYLHHLGWSPDDHPPAPDLFSVHELHSGDAYSLPDPHMWHAVEIIGEPILSVNFTSVTPFASVSEREVRHPLGPLSRSEFDRLRSAFLERLS